MMSNNYTVTILLYDKAEKMSVDLFTLFVKSLTKHISTGHSIKHLSSVSFALQITVCNHTVPTFSTKCSIPIKTTDEHPIVNINAYKTLHSLL